MKLVASLVVFFSLASIVSAQPPAAAGGPAQFVEGKQYFLVPQPQQTGLPPGKVLVTEVFSYACPACNSFQPYMQKLVKSLPPNAVVDYVPASFNSGEDWPMFQLAYETAKALNVAAKAHDAMFDAVWVTGELGTMDGQQLKAKMPTIEDAARFYQKQTGVPAANFVATSKSFGVDQLVRKDEALIRAYGVDRTPTLVVNGKWRVHVQSAGSPELLVALVNYLVAKESK
jgi:protein dithiol oxidoreductase (disulfide-forming)